LINEVPSAVVPIPIWPNTTDGAEVYPPPPLVISTEVTIPAVVTKQVASAPTLLSCEIIVMLSWRVARLVASAISFWGSKNGLTLST